MSSHSTRQGRPAQAGAVAGRAVTLRYHDLTKHSYESVRHSRHTLDWANQPSIHKRYLGLEQHELPRGTLPGDLPPTLELLQRLASPGNQGAERSVSGLDGLSALCRLSYGITAQISRPGLTYSLRAAPSAGALYPCELYLCLRGVDGLADGLYHYAPSDHSLSCLRSGDFLPVLQDATGNDPVLEDTDIVFVISTIWWRSSWKYRERAYRYCLNDTGHLAGNVLPAALSLGYRPAVVYDFLDGEVNHLLRLDTARLDTARLDAAREGALLLVACSAGGPEQQRAGARLEPGSIATAYHPLSAEEVEYALIGEAHAATCLTTPEALLEARRRAAVSPAEAMEHGLPVFPLPEPEGSLQPLAESIGRRRSSRRFAGEPVSSGALSAVLAAIVSDYPSDQAALPPLEVALIANDVVGLPPGAYRYDRAGHRLLQTREGDLRGWASYLSMEQRLCGDAGLCLFLVADLEDGVARQGDRAYRRTYIEAGLRGQFVYLAARALGLGCSGIGAFYDDQAAEFWELDPGRSVIYELVVGREPAAG